MLLAALVIGLAVSVFQAITQIQELTLAFSGVPSWAARAGRDEHGLWAEFSLRGVVQRMRWMNPGLYRLRKRGSINMSTKATPMLISQMKRYQAASAMRRHATT